MHLIINENIDRLNEICRNYNVKRLYVFGSASTGTFNEEESDIDLIVELEHLEPVTKGETLINLWDKFEELFGRRVDLLSGTKVRNPYLQEGIEATKKLIYEA